MERKLQAQETEIRGTQIKGLLYKKAIEFGKL
jgi:hypothetical protein